MILRWIAHARSSSLILRYKQPFVDWINAADPSPTSHTLTLAEVNQEHTVYLVEVEDEDELAEWLARHHEALFEEELRGWYTDPALWPRDRSLKMLEEWCSFDLHTSRTSWPRYPTGLWPSRCNAWGKSGGRRLWSRDATPPFSNSSTFRQ